MITLKPTPSQHGVLELTPLLDIVFIVVVFLLLTANSQLLPLPINIPEADHSTSTQQTPEKSITVSLFSEAPNFAIEQQRYQEWPEFKAALLQVLSNNHQPLAIAVDRGTAAESLLKLLALLNAQKVKNTHILMEESSND